MKKFSKTLKEAQQIIKDANRHDKNIYRLTEKSTPKRTKDRKFFIATYLEWLNF